MKVKITKARRSSFWYAALIGEVIEVVPSDIPHLDFPSWANFPSWAKADNMLFLIEKDDCEIVEEQKAQEKQYVLLKTSPKGKVKTCIVGDDNTSKISDDLEAIKYLKDNLQKTFPEFTYHIAEIIQ